MDFSIPEELTSAQQLAQQILGDFTAPEQIKSVEQGGEFFDNDLWQALAAAGLLGLDIDERHGGSQLGFYALTTLCEEAGRCVAPIPVVATLITCAGTLSRFAPQALQDRWLPAVADGTVLLSAALEEYNNDDPTRPLATAQPVAGGYTVSGTRTCVSNAESAARILISAVTDNGSTVLALLDPATAGVTLTPQLVTSGETRHELRLNEVHIADAEIIATGATAEEALNWAIQATRTALCATMVGLSDKMMRITGSYTTEREQFGRAIATFQAVSHRVADCYIDVECLRLVTQQAASLIDQGRPAEDAVTIAKIWCGDTAHRVSQAAQHCHGGTGVDRDYPLFRYCLASRQIELSMGNSARLTGELGERIAAEFLATA